MSLVYIRHAWHPMLYGGKAANLCRLTIAGLPVPDGFIVPANAGDPGRLREVFENVLYKTCGNGPVAVRSSAVGEDGQKNSFAGRYDSILNVRGTEAILDAIEKVKNSVNTPRAIAYRKRKGLPDVKMAVIVQRMVNATYSAVVFTRHPITGKLPMFCEVDTGLGDGLVSGRRSPIYSGDLLAERSDYLFPAHTELMAQVIRASIVIDAEVDVEAAFDDQMWWIVQARRITTLGDA